MGYFDACKPTFLKPQPWSLAWGYGPGTPSPCLILYKKITQKIAQWACRYCIAFGRWCILISSLFLLRFLSHFSLYYLPLIQLTSMSVIIRIMLTVWILYFHAITGLPHTHALCMTQDVVRFVKMQPAQSPPRFTKCNSPPINGQCTNFVLFDVAL